MKIYTSYFYQIRHFPKTLIPLSTAVWDPRWYHDNKLESNVFKDKRNIINGLKFPDFAPGIECTDLCRGPDHPEICQITNEGYGCSFLNKYREQLDKLDFDEVLHKLKEISDIITSYEKPSMSRKDYDIALVFHETPDNPCSERRVVQDWFKDHGIILEEFNK